MTDALPFERFVQLAKRELAAVDVRLLASGEEPPSAPNAVVVRLSDGRHLVATFEETPENAEVVERRLAMLAGTFPDALGAVPSDRTRTRPPVTSSLHEELKALAQRASAVDAIVIDVDSPVIWGSATVRSQPRMRPGVQLRGVSISETSASSDGALIHPEESTHRLAELASSPEDPPLTRKAVAAVRRLSSLDELHKGRPLRHVARDEDFYLAVSFSSIYVLCLIFTEAFDELRAERAVQESLPRIERLVLALPPLDPGPHPMGSVVAFRSRK